MSTGKGISVMACLRGAISRDVASGLTGGCPMSAAIKNLMAGNVGAASFSAVSTVSIRAEDARGVEIGESLLRLSLTTPTGYITSRPIQAGRSGGPKQAQKKAVDDTRTG